MTLHAAAPRVPCVGRGVDEQRLGKTGTTAGTTTETKPLGLSRHGAHAGADRGAGRSKGGFALGVSTLNAATVTLGPAADAAARTVSFSGRDRVHATRVALDFWYHHRASLRLSASAFLARCLLSSDERTITFLAQPPGRPQSS